MKKSEPKTQVNKKTALASGNGFSYQAYDFLCRLLEFITISGTEISAAGFEEFQDSSIELSSKIVCFQIKKVNGTIYPASFCKQINQFWKEITDESKDIRCCYISTEKVESKNLIKILEFWNKKTRSKSDINSIREFLLKKKNIDKSIKKFVRQNASVQIALRDSLIERMSWCFDDKTLKDVVAEGKNFVLKFIERHDNFKKNISADNLFCQLKSRFDELIDEEVKKGNRFIKLTATTILEWCNEILQKEINAKEEPKTLPIKNESLPQPTVELTPNNPRQISDIFDAEEALLKKTSKSSATLTRIEEIVRKLSLNLKNGPDASRNLIFMQVAIKDVIFARCSCGLDEAEKLNPGNYILEACINFVRLNKFDGDKNQYWKLLDSLIYLELQ